MNQHQYCQQQLQTLQATLQQQPPFNAETPEEATLKFIDTLKQLCSDDHSEDRYQQGQWLISQTIANYPHISPIIPRDLFWYFGGDCLHYMPDEEIAQFQQLEEACYAANPDPSQSNYQEERAKVFGLH